MEVCSGKKRKDSQHEQDRMDVCEYRGEVKGEHARINTEGLNKVWNKDVILVLLLL